MPTVQLYSTEEGKLVDFDLEIDQNEEIVATHGDETLKFPGGLTKTQFMKLVAAHNKINEGVTPVPEEELREREKIAEKNDKLLESL